MLQDTGVIAELHRLELLAEDCCDTAVLVTGDTDLAPAFRTADRLFPHKRILFAFPYKRKNKELAQWAPGSFEMKKEQYTKHQFDDPYVLPNGVGIHKPQRW